MNKSNSIIWYEWFNKERKARFEESTKSVWDLASRNSIGSTIFRKWLREEICSDIKDTAVNHDEIRLIEDRWLSNKKISTKKFETHRKQVLESCNISERNLKIYCINELKAEVWAKELWNTAVEQIYLENKEDFDEIRLGIIKIPASEKGIALEIYQQLIEKEVKFSEIASKNPTATIKTNKTGTWYKRTGLKKEWSQVINSVKEGEASLPIKIGEEYIILKLIEKLGNKLTTEIRDKIITSQMDKFLDFGVEQLLDHAYKLKKGER